MRPDAWQMRVVGEGVSRILAEWLLEGIGVANLEDLAADLTTCRIGV